MNSEVISNIGLKESLDLELKRFERLALLKTTLVYDDEVTLDKNDEIIVFRMLQEFTTNVLKHASASQLDISVINLSLIHISEPTRPY